METTRTFESIVPKWLLPVGLPALYAIIWSAMALPNAYHGSLLSFQYGKLEMPGLAQNRVSWPPATLTRLSFTAPVARPEALVPESVQILTQRRQYALGMIETGNNDYEIGLAGEVSRYQIMPAVWKEYSHSGRYTDPAIATEVARRHWAALYQLFKQQAQREPTDFDMYVLWNTRFGYYASRAYRPARLQPEISTRARNFTNLVALSNRQFAQR